MSKKYFYPMTEHEASVIYSALQKDIKHYQHAYYLDKEVRDAICDSAEVMVKELKETYF